MKPRVAFLGLGEAAARKLLRSIVVKGLTALMVESLRVAESQGLGRWCYDHLVDTLTGLDGAVVRGLLDGTVAHSVRRVAEMEAAASMRRICPPTRPAATTCCSG
ncbi:DUF1932 domain-containing protein [Streptosporangium amethystogenes subsp. fukuiense]|uniref:DUF1932 domain-containing protein n=1 Tax=Streptosporangium amethystogenes subsp. fukuiense TaxID=698418 RepID=A0ABW2SRA5_9ACTN